MYRFIRWGQFIEKLIFEEYAALQRRHLVIYSSRMPQVFKDPCAKLAIAHSPNGVCIVLPYKNMSHMRFNSIFVKTFDVWPYCDDRPRPFMLDAWSDHLGDTGFGVSVGVKQNSGVYDPRKSYLHAKGAIAAYGDDLYDVLCSTTDPTKTFLKDSSKLNFLAKEYSTMQPPLSERVIPWGRGAFISLDGRSPRNPGESLALFVELDNGLQSFDYDNPFIVQVSLCTYVEGPQYHTGRDSWCQRHCLGYGLHDALPFIDCSEPDAVAIANKLVDLIPPELSEMLAKSSRHGIVEPWESFVDGFTPILNSNFPRLNSNSPRYAPSEEVVVRF